jgi:hypothetical protein
MVKRLDMGEREPVAPPEGCAEHREPSFVDSHSIRVRLMHSPRDVLNQFDGSGSV